ncbi:MAG: hypothetical protein ACAI25_17945 [Planctomycetota bacterium]
MSKLGVLLLLGLTFATQGCAILVRGDMQDVTVQSQVPEIRFAVDGVPAKLGEIELDRNRVHVIHAEAPGYDSLELTVYPSINEDWLFAEQAFMWPILWLPMAVDYNSGALNDIPSPIDLTLTKTKEPAPQAATGANPPSTTQPVAEVNEEKRVLKRQPQRPLSVRDARSARSLTSQYGY